MKEDWTFVIWTSALIIVLVIGLIWGLMILQVSDACSGYHGFVEIGEVYFCWSMGDPVPQLFPLPK